MYVPLPHEVNMSDKTIYNFKEVLQDFILDNEGQEPSGDQWYLLNPTTVTGIVTALLIADKVQNDDQ